MSNLLELSGVSKRFHAGQANELTILNDANLTLSKGEIVGLVAPSGAGKSTLLHICGLLDTADEGSVSVDGIELSGATDAMRTKTRREDIGFIYQFHHLLPEFSALENLVIPQMTNGLSLSKAEQRSQELLAWVGLEKRVDHRPAELSGGEQQRVAFCRAMCNAPKLLLADEPTGNLDPATSEHMFELLLKLVRETGLTALIATHNLDLAARMDRQVTLEAGRVVAS